MSARKNPHATRVDRKLYEIVGDQQHLVATAGPNDREWKWLDPESVTMAIYKTDDVEVIALAVQHLRTLADRIERHEVTVTHLSTLPGTCTFKWEPPIGFGAPTGTATK